MDNNLKYNTRGMMIIAMTSAIKSTLRLVKTQEPYYYSYGAAVIIQMELLTQ